MSGFPNGYSAPGAVEKASVTMAHPRAAKRALTGDAEWNTQRSVIDPAAEAEEGAVDGLGYNVESAGPAVVAMPTDSEAMDAINNQLVSDFSKELQADCANCDPDDEPRQHLIKCGQHLAEAKAAHITEDSQATHEQLNKAIAHFRKFRSAVNVQD